VSGHLGAYALFPGAEWTGLAHDWPIKMVSRETEPGHWQTDVVHPHLNGKTVWQTHLVCAVCEQSVTPLTVDDSMGPYTITPGQITSGTLAHIRRCHEDAIHRPVPRI
jgi:hypothetical protein